MRALVQTPLRLVLGPIRTQPRPETLVKPRVPRALPHPGTRLQANVPNVKGHRPRIQRCAFSSSSASFFFPRSATIPAPPAAEARRDGSEEDGWERLAAAFTRASPVSFALALGLLGIPRTPNVLHTRRIPERTQQRTRHHQTSLRRQQRLAQLLQRLNDRHHQHPLPHRL